MGATKEMFLIMQEADFNELPAGVRDKFNHIEVRESNEYETHRDDPNYIKLYKAKKKAKKDLQEYLFNKRHK